MRTCFRSDPTTLDPRKNGDPVTSALLFMLYDGLTQLLPNGDVELSLAESVEISKDKTVYLFRLRKAQWCDGTPLSAHDFEYSWKTSLDPAFQASCPQLFFLIKNGEKAYFSQASMDEVGICAIDARTLRVELQQPAPHFLSVISFCNCFPIPQHVDRATPEWGQSLTSCVSSGPFSLKQWERGERLILEKNFSHWDAKRTALREMHIAIIEDPHATFELLQEGSLDWVSSIHATLPCAPAQEYAPFAKVVEIPSAATLFCAFNVQQFPFDNPNIRKAFSLSIDRRRIAKQMMGFCEGPAHRIIPPSLTLSSRKEEPSFQPASARRFLQKGLIELGICGQTEQIENDFLLRFFVKNLTLHFDDSYENRLLAHALQESWSDILQFRVQLIPSTLKKTFDKIEREAFRMTLRTSCAQYADPLNFLERFKYRSLTRNIPKFESADYIDLFNRSLHTQDVHERGESLCKAEDFLLDQIPFVPIYHPRYPLLVRPNVSNIGATPIHTLRVKRARLAEI